MSYALEVDLIATAHRLELLTTPYVFNTADAATMADAGADIVVCHMGLTTGGRIGATASRSLDECARLCADMATSARAINPDVLVLCHGGPISMPADAAYVLAKTPELHGFYGASSMERLPVENALPDQVRAFTKIRLANTDVEIV